LAAKKDIRILSNAVSVLAFYLHSEKQNLFSAEMNLAHGVWAKKEEERKKERKKEIFSLL
jgi:hypothetical protein